MDSPAQIIDAVVADYKIPVSTSFRDAILAALYKEGFKIVEQEKLTVKIGKVRAGHDFPCCLHKGPAGNCSPWNCRCY